MVGNSVEDGLRAILPESALRPIEARYLHEPRGLLSGDAAAVVAPARTAEVARIIRHAAERRLPVVPFAGGTGLVSGQIRPGNPAPIVLSLERMRRIRAIYPEENVLIAEAGAILVNVQAAAQRAGRLFPLSLASEGSARIGGLLATNAGGVNVLRYGTARELCLGIEAVLPDGVVWNGLGRLRKDNTGYDLRNLLIGSEGTLGVITAAVLRLFPRPAATGTALMVVPDPSAALSLLALAQEATGGGLTAFELIDGQGLAFLAETGLNHTPPFAKRPRWMVLIETGLPPGVEPAAVLEEIFADGTRRGLVSDGVVAQSGAQAAAFWQIREHIPEANRRLGSIASHDIALPLGRIAGFIAKGRRQLAMLGSYRINCFGHLGDGNLHYNVFPMAGERYADRANEAGPVQRLVHDLVAAHDGSISAEHGIGRLKVDDLQHYGDRARLTAMRAIKTALDPLGIMNPGAILPE